MTYARITGMRSARFPLQGCGCVGECGCAETPAVEGLGCGCASMPIVATSGLGATSKFDTAPPNVYASLEGLTPAQNAQVTTLRAFQIPNVVRAFAILGREAPEVSFADVLDLNATKIASASNPALLARSIILYAIARTGQLIERLPLMYRAANLGVPGASAVASRLVSLCNTGISGVRTVLDLLPSPSATSGLGTLPMWVAVVFPLASLVEFLFSSGGVNAETETTCAEQLRITGTRCTAADFARYSAQHSAEDKGALDKIIEEMAKTAGSVIKFVLVGVGVLILGVVAYNYVSYRVGRAVVGSKAGRKVIGAAVGGPAGALAANRRSSRRRVSRRRTSRGRR